ncbi:MAG: RNA-directed DNA polymerase [Brevundimonas sp.]|uniref:RNA-directed DNA polymerase n=1 Tax=Brevundimonas sp. TaxID=1871086 RepID=UPI002ABC7D4F|nr:RNA-directed DNA polymerase [Brevundimonas sp.]MDZ4110203.1 RNA-directed DNA polymerase [Brevundimonas sp.]
MAVSPPTIEPFIRYGLLPENLPPVLSPGSLWSHYSSYGGSYVLTKDCVGKLSPYDASKRGGQRRSFSIVHPTFVYEQAAFYAKHWKDVEPLLSRSPGSASIPEFPTHGPRATKITAHADLPRIRFRRLSRYKFCLVADVSRCFPSIYTHSIPWAIHGKSQSKADTNPKSASVFGNRLDAALRQSQDRQTMGIPVGPDTSRLTSEIVLSAVDEIFLTGNPSARGAYVRHVDDYWIGASTYEEAEAHLRRLRRALNEYELDINELKTRVVRCDEVLGESWPSDLERDLDRSLSKYPFMKTGQDSVSTFGKILETANRRNDEGIIRHAIKKIDERKSWSDNWDVLEHFLAQCTVQFPHSLDYVARVIAWRVRSGLEIDKKLWIEIFRGSIARAAGLGRDSEVIWSLWALKELKSKLTQNLSQTIVDNNSPIVLAFLAHMYANNLTSDKGLLVALWEKVDGNIFCDQFWPLTLELNHLDIKNPATSTVAGADQPMRTLHDQKLSLFDWSAGPAVFRIPSGKKGNPKRAIEAYTSDYDDDGDYGYDPEIDFDDGIGF